MNHRYIEGELSHLEQVFPYIANGPLPISYWIARLEVLTLLPAMRDQRRRLALLQDRLETIARFATAAQAPQSHGTL